MITETEFTEMQEQGVHAALLAEIRQLVAIDAAAREYRFLEEAVKDRWLDHLKRAEQERRRDAARSNLDQLLNGGGK